MSFSLADKGLNSAQGFARITAGPIATTVAEPTAFPPGLRQMHRRRIAVTNRHRELNSGPVLAARLVLASNPRACQPIPSVLLENERYAADQIAIPEDEPAGQLRLAPARSDSWVAEAVRAPVVPLADLVLVPNRGTQSRETPQEPSKETREASSPDIQEADSEEYCLWVS